MVGELVQADVRHHQVSSPTSSRTVAQCDVEDAVLVGARRAGGVLVSRRNSEQHHPGQTGVGRVGRPPCGPMSSVCWTTPGMEPIGRGSDQPLGDEHRQDQLPGLAPRLGHHRPHRRRVLRSRAAAGPAGSDRHLAISHGRLSRRRIIDGPCCRSRRLRRLVRRPLRRADTGSPAPRARRPAGRPRSSANASARSTDRRLGATTSTRSPCSSRSWQSAGPITAIIVYGVRLARDADQVADGGRGGEHHGIELAGLDRLADRCRRWRRPYGAVRGDVLDLPAEPYQSRSQGLGGDVGARQEHPVDRVEHVVVRRELRGQPGRGLLTLGTRSGSIPQAGGPAPSPRRRRRP